MHGRAMLMCGSILGECIAARLGAARAGNKVLVEMLLSRETLGAAQKADPTRVNGHRKRARDYAASAASTVPHWPREDTTPR